MFQLLRRWWIKCQLRNYQCKVSFDTTKMSSQAKLLIEPHVRLGRVKMFARQLNVGAYSYIRSGSEIYGDCKVGRFCSIAPNVIIGLESNQHPQDWLSTSTFTSELEAKHFSQLNDTQTVIGNDCWIGRDAIVMTGITIGHGAIVGARALVTKDVPPYAVVVGVPAKIIRYRYPEDITTKLILSTWWNLPVEYLKTLNMQQPTECITQIANLTFVPVQYPKITISQKRLMIE